MDVISVHKIWLPFNWRDRNCEGYHNALLAAFVYCCGLNALTGAIILIILLHR